MERNGDRTRSKVGFAELAVLAVAYFVLASATIFSTRFGGGVACLWIASPVLVAYLSTREEINWWPPIIACAIASWLATTFFGFGITAAPVFSVINMAESALAAWLVTRMPQRSGLDSLPQVTALILCAGLIAPATTGFPAAWASQWVSGSPYWSNWSNWLAGHGLGAVAVLPIAMLAMRGETAEWYRQTGRWAQLEALLVLLFVGLVTWFVFRQERLPLLFLPILPVIVATFRFGRFGAAMSLLLVAMIGGIFTLSNHGLISSIDGGPAFRAQFYQFYTAILVLITLPIAADLKRRKQLFEELQVSEARYRLVTDNATDIVMNLDVDGRILYVSPSIRTLGGYDPKTLTGADSTTLVHPDDIDAVRETHLLALRDPSRAHTVEYRGLTAQGDYQWFETNTRSLLDGDGTPTGVISVVRNISRRKLVEWQLTRAALTDPLTGLANRRAFNEALDWEFAENKTRQSCLAMFDLDHFKRVNDGFGHDAGDKVLQTFAAIALAATRESDVVARLGGEEFGILLRGTSVEVAARICERLRDEFGTSVTRLEDGIELRATVSAGVASLATAEDRAALLRSADAALYRAKHSGRNRLSLAA